MKIKIIEEPEAPKMSNGGFFNAFPWAGALSPNPFGLIKSSTETDDVNINDSIKAAPEEKANAEYEKGEAVLKFDFGGMFRVQGKKHSEGGTPVIADKGDFVFSDDKDLHLTKEERKIFELKPNGSNKKKDNTPAKILLNEVDPKHYNKMYAIANDPNKDDIAKTTAQLMLGKALEKAGQVAYLQEAKKGFPQGLPDFSQGTAPVKQPEIQKDIDSEDMYQGGGRVGFNGMNSWLNFGLPIQKNTKAICPPGVNCQPSRGSFFKPAPNPRPVTQPQQTTIPYINTRSIPNPDANWDRVPQSTPRPEQPFINFGIPQSTPRTLPNTPFEGFNVGMNALESASVALPFLTAFAQPTYYDMLQQKHTPEIRLDRFNNAPEINDIQQQSALSQREAASTLPGIQARAANEAIRANALGAIGNSYYRTNQANTGIANQESQINAQNFQNDQLFNLQNIRATFNNNTRAQQYRNEELTNGFNQSFNNLEAVQRNLDVLNQTATQSVLPYLSNVGITADGQVVDKDDPRAVRTQQVPPITFGRNRSPIATGYGNIFSVPGQNNNQQLTDMVLQLAQRYIAAGATADAAIRSAAYTYGTLNRPNSKGMSPAEEIFSNMSRGYIPYTP